MPQSPNSLNRASGAGIDSTASCALAASISRRAHDLRIALVGRVDGDDDAPDAVGVHPVLHRAGHERQVRHDQRRALEGLDLGRAGVDAAHEALVLPDHHPVADADAALPQQDQPGDEIVGDALQAEADADRKAAGDPGEPVGVDAEPRRRRPAARSPRRDSRRWCGSSSGRRRRAWCAADSGR